MCWHHVYLSLGANLGQPSDQLNQAIALLNRSDNRFKVCSHYYRTAPWGKNAQSQPDYINAVAHFMTTLSPHALLMRTQSVERHMGRAQQRNRHAPRLIDLDILFYDNWRVSNATLTIPHPLLSQRAFVLKPLIDLTGTVNTPLGYPLEQWLSACQRQTVELASTFPGLIAPES